MKVYLICLTLLPLYSHAAEQPTEPREWDAQAYAQGNRFQETAALRFLQDSALNLRNKKVVDLGCGTGNITTKIAQSAKKVHGFDASNNMIEYAKTTYPLPNLTFEQSLAEQFVTRKQFDTALTFFCIHWIENKHKAFEQINKALKVNGEFFGTHQSSSDPEPLHFTVLKEIIPGFTGIQSFLKTINFTQSADYHIISDEEFVRLLEANGFELISYEQKSFDIEMNRKEVEDSIRPVLMSRPFMKVIPEAIATMFFNYYIGKVLERVPGNDNKYMLTANMWGTKVFHAKKIKNI